MPDRMYIALLVALLAVLPQATVATDDVLPVGVRSVLKLRDVPAETLSIYVEDVATGDAVLQWLPDAPRNPASTMKLLTTLVALDVLGPTYRWRTEVHALGEIDGGDVGHRVVRPEGGSGSSRILDHQAFGLGEIAEVLVEAGQMVEAGDVLARLEDGSVVAVRQRNVIATAFHPELAGEVRFHRLLTTMAGAYEEPAEGSGRRPHPTRRGLEASR